MKIAYIVLKGMPLGGGIEKYTEEVGSRLVERGHDVVIYSMRHYGARDGYYKGMKIKTVPSIKSRSFEKITATFIATVMQCLEKEVDIVHFHAFGPSMFCFIPRVMGRKVVVQGHGIEWMRSKWGQFGKTFLKISELPSVRFPHCITVVSKVQQEYLKKTYGKESVYIPTGVNHPRIEKPDLITRYCLDNNNYILFVARLVKEKGAHYLIEAYKRLKTDLKLVIAGDAKYENSYKAHLKDMSSDNPNIIFTGFVTGKFLNELLSNCYLFVLPSEIEGLSTALLEAMSYGNCCLVSDIPENVEVIKDYGYTFRSKDINDLYEKLKFLIDNPDAVKSVKEQAKRHVLEHYTWDKIALQFEELYQQLLDSYNSPKYGGL